MEIEKSEPNFVIRLQDVALDRKQLEAALGVSLDRYESSRHSQWHYAQVRMDRGKKGWPAIEQFLETIGPIIRDLIHRRGIGAATMDLAIQFPNGMAAISSKVPARIALLAGQGLIDIETSIYLTSSDD